MDEMDEMNKAAASGGGGGGGGRNDNGTIPNISEDEGDGNDNDNGKENDIEPAAIVEVANVRVGSMVRMATVDK